MTTTPHDATLLSHELSETMHALATLDLHPVENAADLDVMRATAERLTRELLAYLVTSDNFAPVFEQPDAVQEWEL